MTTETSHQTRPVSLFAGRWAHRLTGVGLAALVYALSMGPLAQAFAQIAA